MKNIGVLLSGKGTNYQAIQNACAAGEIKGQIVCVGSDDPTVYGLERAKKTETPTFILPYDAFSNLETARLNLGVPADFDEDLVLWKSGLGDTVANRRKIRIRASVEYQLLIELEKYNISLLVLAGFMRILSPYFLDRFQKDGWKVMNIHPAILPSFPGTNGYQDAWDYGVKVHGSTVHFVDYGMDTGPIINQVSYRRYPTDDFGAFKTRGLEKEWQLYVDCVRLFCADRLLVENVGGRNKVTLLT